MGLFRNLHAKAEQMLWFGMQISEEKTKQIHGCLWDSKVSKSNLAVASLEPAGRGRRIGPSGAFGNPAQKPG